MTPWYPPPLPEWRHRTLQPAGRGAQGAAARHRGQEDPRLLVGGGQNVRNHGDSFHKQSDYLITWSSDHCSLDCSAGDSCSLKCTWSPTQTSESTARNKGFLQGTRGSFREQGVPSGDKGFLQENKGFLQGTRGSFRGQGFPSGTRGSFKGQGVPSREQGVPSRDKGFLQGTRVSIRGQGVPSREQGVPSRDKGFHQGSRGSFRGQRVPSGNKRFLQGTRGSFRGQGSL